MHALPLLFLVLLIGGCPPPPVARSYPAPRAEDLLSHLRQHGAALSTLRARAKADYKEGATRVRVTVSALAARPDRLRLAAENALVGPVLTMATDGERFQLLDVRGNRYLSGPAAPCALSRILRVELSPREVVSVLFGSVPLPEFVRKATVAWDGREGGREVLTLTDEADRVLELRLLAAARTFDLREAELRDAAGRPLWRIRHEGFVEEPLAGALGVRLPAQTTVEDPPHGSDLRLRFRERELNPGLPDDAFRMEAPEGVTSEAARCGS